MTGTTTFKVLNARTLHVYAQCIYMLRKTVSVRIHAEQKPLTVFAKHWALRWDWWFGVGFVQTCPVQRDQGQC